MQIIIDSQVLLFHKGGFVRMGRKHTNFFEKTLHYT